MTVSAANLHHGSASAATRAEWIAGCPILGQHGDLYRSIAQAGHAAGDGTRQAFRRLQGQSAVLADGRSLVGTLSVARAHRGGSVFTVP